MNIGRLVSFLKTGSVAGLHVGLAADEMFSIAGDPSYESFSANSKIFGFGELELGVAGGKIVSIAFKFWKSTRRKYPPRIRGLLRPSGNANLRQFQEFLRQNRIGFKLHPTQNTEREITVLCDSGVKIHFSTRHGAMSLDSIHVYDQQYISKRALERVSELEGIQDAVRESIREDEPQS